jgi:hypothetical protein
MACGRKKILMRMGGHKITDVIKYRNSKIRQVTVDDPRRSYNDGEILDSVFWQTTEK